MQALSMSVDVNPAGATPVLSREQVWRGLVLKAENAVPFVPGMESCLSEADRGLLLTFTFAVSFPGVEPGSAEEKGRAEAMKSSYLSAIETTLRIVRRLVQAGQL